LNEQHRVANVVVFMDLVQAELPMAGQPAVKSVEGEQDVVRQARFSPIGREGDVMAAADDIPDQIAAGHGSAQGVRQIVLPIVEVERPADASPQGERVIVQPEQPTGDVLGHLSAQIEERHIDLAPGEDRGEVQGVEGTGVNVEVVEHGGEQFADRLRLLRIVLDGDDERLPVDALKKESRLDIEDLIAGEGQVDLGGLALVGDGEHAEVGFVRSVVPHLFSSPASWLASCQRFSFYVRKPNWFTIIF
jgi:hypothetical protein